MQSQKFLYADEVPVEAVQEGIQRQILGYNPDLMLVKVWFEDGAEGYQHSHPHSQTTYIESGVFDVTIDGETRRQSAGDCYFIPPDALHGAICIEAGVLIDVFSPMRADFIGLEEEA